jgi:Fe-S-cluster containining protein
VSDNVERQEGAGSPDPAPSSSPGRDWAVLSVELGTPEGPIRGKVRVDTGPMSLAELVPTAHELTSVLAARAEKREAALGHRVSCRAGCGACCRQMVPLSPPEVFHLMDLLDAMDPIRRAGILGRFEAIEAELHARGMVEGMLDIEVGADPHRSLNRQYYVLRLACPFLVNESCSIHADRPVACRDYSVTSDPLFCHDPWGGGVRVIDMPMPLSASLAWLTGELLDEPPRLIPLTLAPRWAAEHADWREKRWPGLELFQRFMAIAGKPPAGTAPGGPAGSASLDADEPPPPPPAP